MPIEIGYAQKITELGEVQAIVVPNLFHDRFFAEAFDQFPRAQRFANSACCAHYRDWMLQPLESKTLLKDEFEWETLEGCPKIMETVFFHRPTKSLIFADLVFPIRYEYGFFSNLLLRLAGIGPGPRPSRLYRSLIQDESAFRRSVDSVLNWDFQIAIGGHGEVLATEAKKRLAEGLWKIGKLEDRKIGGAA